MSMNGAARKFESDAGLEFGCFRLDPEQKILWRESQLVPLGPKVVQTLFVLATNLGEVVGREEIIRQVWAETTVEDSNLAHNIFVLRKVLKEDPSGRFTIETVPRRGYRLHERNPPFEVPPKRIADSDPSEASASVPISMAIRVRRWAGLVLGLSALIVVGAVGLHLTRVRAADKGHHRHSVAVLGFANLSQSSEAAWLSPALSEMLSSELGAGGTLLTIPDESVARARAELNLENRNGFSLETLGKLRQNLSADLIVSGAYTVLPPKPAGAAPVNADPQVRLDLRVQNSTTGETLDTISEAGGQSSLFDLIARVGARVRQDLGADTIGAEEAEQVRSSVSTNSDALRLYAEGIQKMRAFDALAARDLLQQAVKADSDYALAYSALAEAWMTLGYDQKAEQAAKAAFQLSGKLGLEQKLLIEGRYREAAHQWPEAISAYSTLFHAYPDNLEYGLRLARAQRLGARYPDAQATLQTLHKLSVPFSTDPRIDLEESTISEASGDTKAAERAAEAAEQKGRERGSALLVARAKLVLPMSSRPAFVAEQEEARQTCERLGDMDCVGQAWLRIGSSQVYHPSAQAHLERALAIFKQVGDQRRVGEAQRLLSSFFLYRRDAGGARRWNAAARLTCEIIGDRSCMTRLVLDDGNIDDMTGDVAGAEVKYRQALALARQTGEDQLIWGSLNNIAALLSDDKGDLPQAEATYRQLVEIDRKSGKQWRMDFTLSNLGAVLAEEGHLQEARGVLTEVQDDSFRLTGRRDFGSSMITLADIDMAEGRPRDAEAKLLPMAKVLESDHNGFAVTYYDEIAAVELAQNKTSEAQRTAAHARALLGDQKTGFDSYHLAITETKIAAALQPDSPAVQATSLARLREITAECKKSGYVGLELAARLAQGEIEMQMGVAKAGGEHLLRLEQDAGAKGFGLIASQAGTARQVALAQQH